MSKLKRPALKTYFETGDIPTQGQFYDVIDSTLNLKEEGTETANATISASGFIAENNITASGNINVIGDITSGGTASFSGGISADKIITSEISSSTSLLIIPSNITSSGNISASNIIATSNLTVLGTSSLNYFNPSTISASGDISTGANLFIVGNITASGNISASGDLVTRNITASGNISASGDIAGNTITVAGTNFINFQTSIVGTGYRINSGAGPLNILGNITASSNISASGHIIGERLYPNGFSSQPFISTENGQIKSSTGFVGTNITASGNISASGEYISGNRLYAYNSIYTSNFSDIDGQGFNFIRNITASGAISASSFLYGERAIIERIESPDSTSDIYFANGINVFGANITASGHISASGHIIGERLTLGGTEITSTAAEINFLDGVLSTVKDAYDSVSYDGESGELTFTELDNNTDVIDLGIGILDSPTFKGVTLTTTDVTSHSWNSEADSNTKSFSFNTVVPLVGAGRSSDFQTVSNSQVSSTSIILASTSHTIPVLITHVIDSSFKFHFYNTTTSAISGTEVQINFTVI